MDIKTLAASQKARLADERERNRRAFSAGGELQDMFRSAGIDGQIFHAANFETGEEIGTEPDEYCRRFGGVPCTYWPNGVGHG